MISLSVRGNGFEFGIGPLPRLSGISSLSYLINAGGEPTTCTVLDRGWDRGGQFSTPQTAERVRTSEETVSSLESFLSPLQMDLVGGTRAEERTRLGDSSEHVMHCAPPLLKSWATACSRAVWRSVPDTLPLTRD